MTKLTPEMKQQLVAVPDLSQQPDSKYILILGSLPKPQYHAVDGYHLKGSDIIEFYRGSGSDYAIIYVCRVRESQWAIVNRAATNIISKEELVRHTTVDVEETNRILKEIDPDMFAQAEKLFKAAGMEIDGANTDKPSPGQYI